MRKRNSIHDLLLKIPFIIIGIAGHSLSVFFMYAAIKINYGLLIFGASSLMFCSSAMLALTAPWIKD